MKIGDKDMKNYKKNALIGLGIILFYFLFNHIVLIILNYLNIKPATWNEVNQVIYLLFITFFMLFIIISSFNMVKPFPVTNHITTDTIETTIKYTNNFSNPLKQWGIAIFPLSRITKSTANKRLIIGTNE